jgi:YesN/AraC family two-component response regulator
MSGYDFGQLRVLLCDDSRHIRMLVRTFLQGFGIDAVYEAADATEGWRLFLDNKPDLVITDWHMPPTDGLDLVRRIRSDPDSPNPFVAVIMLTGYTELYRVKQARDAGVSVFLAKPVSAASLYKRLCAVVDDQRAFVRAEAYFGPDRRIPRRDLYDGHERRSQMAQSAA